MAPTNHGHQEAIQLILDEPRLQKWLHCELPERLPIKLLSNKFVKEEYQLFKFGMEVQILDSELIKSENIQDVIVIDVLETKNDTMSFRLFHQIEGALILGRLTKGSKDWQLLIDTVGEL